MRPKAVKWSKTTEFFFLLLSNSSAAIYLIHWIEHYRCWHLAIFPRLFLHSLSKLQRVSLGTFWNENWCTSTFCVMEMTFCDRNLYVENTLKVWRRNGDNYCRRYTHTHISIVSDGYKYWLEIDLSGIKWLLFSVHIVLLFFPPLSLVVILSSLMDLIAVTVFQTSIHLKATYHMHISRYGPHSQHHQFLHISITFLWWCVHKFERVRFVYNCDTHFDMVSCVVNCWLCRQTGNSRTYHNIYFVS